MKKILFLILPALLLVISSCSKDDDDGKDKPARVFTFTAKSISGPGSSWSIPHYDFTYNEEYSHIIVEAEINGATITVGKSPTTSGTLYYKLNEMENGEYRISIYNVAPNGSIPITISIYS